MHVLHRRGRVVRGEGTGPVGDDVVYDDDVGGQARTLRVREIVEIEQAVQPAVAGVARDLEVVAHDPVVVADLDGRGLELLPPAEVPRSL